MSEIAEEVLTTTEEQAPAVQAESIQGVQNLPPPGRKKEIPKIRTIVFDTLTGSQKTKMFEMWEEGNITQAEWRDFGVEINIFIRRLMLKGFKVVLILGPIGTGKTYGMKYLPTKTNILFNTDGKELTYKGGEKEYGTPPYDPTNYMILPRTYEDAMNVIDRIKAKGNLHEKPVAFLIGHVEDYKSVENTQRQRLQTLGRLTHKVEVEDLFTMCYYSEAYKEGELTKYRLRTQNSGFDTARTKEGQHESLYIENNFQLILDSIDAY